MLQEIFVREEQVNIVPPPPPSDHKQNSFWIDEQIWGHRVYPQSPWLLFLEFFCMAEATHRAGQLLSATNGQGKYYPIEFKPEKRILLRNILWNNDQIGQIAESNRDSATAWEIWLGRMSQQVQGVDLALLGNLRDRLGPFHDFADLVSMLRESAVESQSNKRWTSRFVFPFGANAAYEDLDSKGNFPRDYINFTRTGELLYMMLSRSAYVDDLIPKVKALLDGENVWNSLLGLLQRGDDRENLSPRGKSYLPYIKHPIYDDLGKDWMTLFNLDLPGFDVVGHLVTLAAFYMFLYQLRVAADWASSERGLHFICEVVAPRKTPVRELSILSYQENGTLTNKALTAFIDSIEGSQQWQHFVKNAPVSEAHALCKQYLLERVWWNGEDSASTPEALLADLREQVQHRHRQHEGNVHRELGRDIGLISRRGTSRFRYAPTDSFLKTLLLANVPNRMEFHEFLDVLYQRYGLVFGEREASKVIDRGNFDKRPFDLNTGRLEQRLSSLGMLRRLSDGCAYVINPLV